MNCEREIEVVAALTEGRWPDGCEASLREHLNVCASCAEVLQIASAIRAEHAAALAEADVPPSGAVWWRAQQRAKQEALDTAANAITIVQATSVSVALVAALTIAGFTRDTWSGWMARFYDGLYFGAIEFAPAANVVLLVGAASALLLAPFVVWFAVVKE